MKGLIGKIDRKLPNTRAIFLPKRRYKEKEDIDPVASSSSKHQKKNSISIIPGKLSQKSIAKIKKKKEIFSAAKMKNRRSFKSYSSGQSPIDLNRMRRIANPSAAREFL